ncbi:hypothetical protein STEG23_004428 [Scotinomys teguina]
MPTFPFAQLLDCFTTPALIGAAFAYDLNSVPIYFSNQLHETCIFTKFYNCAILEDAEAERAQVQGKNYAIVTVCNPDMCHNTLALETVGHRYWFESTCQSQVTFHKFFSLFIFHMKFVFQIDVIGLMGIEQPYLEVKLNEDNGPMRTVAFTPREPGD